jgi:hypothetical protein
MSRGAWFAVLVGWGVVAIAGYWFGIDYAATESSVQSPPDQWPAESDISRDPALPTLLIFIHPRCPCTRASVSELDRLLARHPGQMTVFGIVFRPAEMHPDWAQTSTVSHLKAIPGVKVLEDDHGVYRRLFRISTSGECLLYDTNGKLTFHGGLTVARGHEGSSQGQESLSALLLNQECDGHTAPVYGCPLETVKHREVGP